MAVEPKRVQGRLKALFPKANLTKKRLVEITTRLSKRPEDDATDEEIDEVINSFNEIFSFEEIAKEDDRKATYVTQLEDLKKKVAETSRTTDPSENYQTKGNGKDEGDNDSADPMQEMMGMLKEFQKDIIELKTGKVLEAKTNTARSVFEKNEVFKALPEDAQTFYFNQIDVDSEESIEDQIQNLEDIHKQLIQTTADSQQHAGSPPVGRGGKDEPSKEELDAMIDIM